MAKKPKYTYAQLALLDWLCEAGPGQRFFSEGGGPGARSGLYFFEIGKRNPNGKYKVNRLWPTLGGWDEDKSVGFAFLDRLGGRDNIDTLLLMRAGFFETYHQLGFTLRDQDEGKKRFAKFIASFDHNPLHYSDTAATASKAAFEYWSAEGKDELARLRVERQQEIKAIERHVLIGRSATVYGILPDDIKRHIPEGLNLALPSREIIQPYALARVVKESSTRLYLRDVSILAENNSATSYDHPVQGRAPNEYVEKGERVLLDHADTVITDRLVAINKEYAADLQRLTLDLIERILPILSEMHSRMEQKGSEREDMIREAIERHRAAAKSAAEPVEEAPGGPRP